MLRLSDLVDLPRPGSPDADLDRFEVACRSRGLEWPTSVVQQVLFDHGAKMDFIEQYDHLDLLALNWKLVALPASQLVESTFFDGFAERARSVAAHPYWTLDQYRPGHGNVWMDTWRVPPVLLDGRLRKPPQEALHLIEGHTRLGVLLGMVGLGEIGLDSTHQVYLA